MTANTIIENNIFLKNESYFWTWTIQPQSNWYIETYISF